MGREKRQPLYLNFAAVTSMILTSKTKKKFRICNFSLSYNQYSEFGLLSKSSVSFEVSKIT